MFSYLALDRGMLQRIQSAACFFTVVALFACGCDDSKKEKPVAPPDTVTEPDTQPPVEPTEPEAADAGVDAGADADSGAVQEPEDPAASEGIQGEGDEAVVRAVGRARRGHDMGLSRQAAANRARRRISKILKEKGYSLESPGILRGVSIERTWTRGRFVYALGVLPLSAVEGGMNESSPDASNQPEAERARESNPPQGGELP